MPKPKPCKYCGEIIQNPYGAQFICEKPECKDKHKVAYQKEYQKEYQRKHVYANRSAKIKFKKKKRVCLRCDKKFASVSPENRICPTCKDINADRYVEPVGQSKWLGL